MNVKELCSLKDRVCLVTGGAGQYGSCMVEGLAEAGGTVITASRNLEAGEAFAEQMRTQGLDVHAMQVDQTDHQSVVALRAAIKTKFGTLNVFVNNAVGRFMKGYDSDLKLWEQSMDANATGMFDITREMAALIAESGGGNIVNIASMMGMFGPDLSNYEGTDMPDPSPDYFFHRAGMINFTRYLARRLAGQNIIANCISPGGLFNHQNPVFLKNYCKKVPVGRMAERDDIKGLVVLLASKAAAYINGQNILMDGGMHC